MTSLILVFLNLILPARANYEDLNPIYVFNNLDSVDTVEIEMFQHEPRLPRLFDELLYKIASELGHNKGDVSFDVSGASSFSVFLKTSPSLTNLRLVAGCFHTLEAAKHSVQKYIQDNTNIPGRLSFISAPLFLVFLADTNTFALIPTEAPSSSSQTDPLILGPFSMNTLITTNPNDLNLLDSKGRLLGTLISQWLRHEDLLLQWAQAQSDFSQLEAGTEDFDKLLLKIDRIDDQISTLENNRIRDIELLFESLKGSHSDPSLALEMAAHLLPRTMFLNLKQARDILSMAFHFMQGEGEREAELTPHFVSKFLQSASQMSLAQVGSEERFKLSIFTQAMIAFIETFTDYLNSRAATSLLHQHRPLFEQYFTKGIPLILADAELTDNHDPGHMTMYTNRPKTSLELPGIPDLFLGQQDPRSPRELATQRYSRWISNLLRRIGFNHSRNQGPLVDLLLNSTPLPQESCGSFLEEESPN